MSFNDSGFSKGSLVNRVSMIGASMMAASEKGA